MKRWFILGAAVLQLAVLAYMAGQREWIVRRGHLVRLRTAPIDPRDVMRGDYVRLDYEISRVPHRLWQGSLKTNLPSESRVERRVYASLKVGSDGVGEVTALSLTPPKEGLYLRGWTQPFWGGGQTLVVRYGIEAFFMEQGQAQALEDAQRGPRRGTPLEVEVAVNSGGIAVLKGYRWEPLGIQLEFETQAVTNAPARPFPVAATTTVVRAVTVSLTNQGTNAVAVVDLPAGRSFALVEDPQLGLSMHRWVGEGQTAPAPRPEDVIVLQPGESRRTRLDLTRPEWFVASLPTKPPSAGPRALASLTDNWQASFRIEYRPPTAAASAGLPQAALIQHRVLRSQRFSPSGPGRID